MGTSNGGDDDDTLCPIAHSTGLVGDRWSILIVQDARSTCFQVKPRTSEMRALVAMQISTISLYGSSSRAKTPAVCSKDSGQRSRLWRFLPSFARLDGLRLPSSHRPYPSAWL